MPHSEHHNRVIRLEFIDDHVHFIRIDADRTVDLLALPRGARIFSQKVERRGHRLMIAIGLVETKLRQAFEKYIATSAAAALVRR